MNAIQEAVKHFRWLYDKGALTEEELPHIEDLELVFTIPQEPPDFDFDKYAAKFKDVPPEVLVEHIGYWRRRALNLEWAIDQLDQRMHKDETFMTVTEGDEEIIKFYNIPCGPWHRILGIVRGS